MFEARRTQLVLDVADELETFLASLRSDDFDSARKKARDNLFVAMSALFGEGFDVCYRDELKRMHCDVTIAEKCPLSVSAFFAAVADFAADARKPG